MAKKKEEPDYITHVSKVKIGGYKSIESVSIEFEKGLNILIGQNGTGKSNFFEALSYPIFALKSVQNINHSWDVEFNTLSGKIVRWDSIERKQKNGLENKVIIFEGFLMQKIYLDDVLLYDSSNPDDISKYSRMFSEYRQIIPIIRDNNIILYQGNKIHFNLPVSMDAFLMPLFYVNYRNQGSFMHSPESIKIIDNKMRMLNMNGNFTQPWNQKKVKEELLAILVFDESIKRRVSQVTPIEDFRFKEIVNINIDERKYSIENIILEFKVQGKWMPWSWLSDGTKRLFYIVSEVASQEHGIILIEEPELGIHPHQFHLLMNFLKEESRDKQIIVSTHSPQALDYLDADELSHIIIADYDDKKGTQLRKLKAKEIKDALKYSKEIGNLSDYWIHMDLEGNQG